MKTFRWFAASAIALATVPFTAAPAQISAQRLSDIDRHISSDAFEGRGPATRAETKTIEYIAQQFQEAGLQPAGDTVDGKRGWFQTVPLLKSEWAAAPEMTLLLDGKPAALTQGLRDLFGAHTYNRVDAEGTFHTLWGEDRSEVEAVDTH